MLNRAAEPDTESELEAPVASTEMEVRGTRLDEVERDHILRVLEQIYWRIEGPQGAAAILGMNPGTLRSRMKKLGIRRPRVRDVPRNTISGA